MTAAVALGWSPAASATSMVRSEAETRLKTLDGSSPADENTSSKSVSTPFLLPLAGMQLSSKDSGAATANTEWRATYGILRAIASQSIDGPASSYDDSLADVTVTFTDTLQAAGGPGMDSFMARFFLDGTISASVLSGVVAPATTTASYSVRVAFGDGDDDAIYASFLWGGETTDALPGGASSSTSSSFEVNGAAVGGTMDPLPGGLFTTPSISFDLSKPLTISVEVSATATGLNEGDAVLASTSDIGQSFEWDTISTSTGCIGDSGTDWCAFQVIPEPGTTTLLTPLAALLALALRRARPLR
jgi:hypothetical protein